MRIEDILKKQGKLYKNLTSNKTIQKCNETINSDLVLYEGHMILKQEHNAISSLEKMLNEKLVIVNNPTIYNKFEISIDNNQIIYLKIASLGLTNIPKEISFLPNLQVLYLDYNQITKLENLDNLSNLQRLDLYSNQISKIENLDNLPNLQILYLHKNPIKNKEEVIKLRKKGIKVGI